MHQTLSPSNIHPNQNPKHDSIKKEKHFKQVKGFFYSQMEWLNNQHLIEMNPTENTKLVEIGYKR